MCLKFVKKYKIGNNRCAGRDTQLINQSINQNRKIFFNPLLWEKNAYHSWHENGIQIKTKEKTINLNITAPSRFRKMMLFHP